MAGTMTRIMSCKFKSSYCLVGGSLPLNLITRRGYSAIQADEGSTKREHQQKSEEKRANSVSTESSSSWAPDPVTGYYRPSSTQTNEGIINNNNKNTNKP